MPNKVEDPIFYALPAQLVAEGMSTDDGQDVVSVTTDGGRVVIEVYTRRSDDPVADEINRSEPESRVYGSTDRVGLAVFPDTHVDGRHLAS